MQVTVDGPKLYAAGWAADVEHMLAARAPRGVGDAEGMVATGSAFEGLVQTKSAKRLLRLVSCPVVARLEMREYVCVMGLAPALQSVWTFQAPVLGKFSRCRSRYVTAGRVDFVKVAAFLLLKTT